MKFGFKCNSLENNNNIEANLSLDFLEGHNLHTSYLQRSYINRSKILDNSVLAYLGWSGISQDRNVCRQFQTHDNCS
jgi:hypothetical protein